jgi:hypothetical protein
LTATSTVFVGSRMHLFTGAGIRAAPAGGVPASRPLRLDKRLELLERRLSEQETLLERLRESLRMPQRPAVLTPSPPRNLTNWRRTALAVGYAFGVFARLIVAGMTTILALAVVAATLRLISK